MLSSKYTLPVESKYITIALGVDALFTCYMSFLHLFEPTLPLSVYGINLLSLSDEARGVAVTLSYYIGLSLLMFGVLLALSSQVLHSKTRIAVAAASCVYQLALAGIEFRRYQTITPGVIRYMVLPLVYAWVFTQYPEGSSVRRSRPL
eukprot:TRINITY_DN4179_c0_g1_i2.p1 TRINITY_DN4179_c0_g1~~TRINITY_DN4179_c0_g1_i2.p1  ORF type:complete len:148 (-),score=21.07 TRINITY_DN4179_c0_g1_i2:118-561(-)